MSSRYEYKPWEWTRLHRKSRRAERASRNSNSYCAVEEESAKDREQTVDYKASIKFKNRNIG